MNDTAWFPKSGRTEWIPVHMPPVRKGWYEVNWWNPMTNAPHRAYYDPAGNAGYGKWTECNVGIRVWRGLVEPATDKTQETGDQMVNDLVKILCVLQAVEPRVRNTKFFVDLAVKYGHLMLDKNVDKVIHDANETVRWIKGWR